MRRKMIALLGVVLLMAFFVPQALAVGVEDIAPSFSGLWSWLDTLITSIGDLFEGSEPKVLPLPLDEPDKTGGFVEPLG